MTRIELTTEQHQTLLRVMTEKAKAIHAWINATKSHVRDDEYRLVRDALTAIAKVEELEK